ncbi:hypothetical protein ACH5Y9_11190 [Methylomonas sp. BW4-1]|uniref:hypothetical protein n=1 Tax=unclassified Methylomonas TaxID=2608980 RepID=UPI0010548162|nr:hypothetical protein [Methylomonas sp. Kb3]
MEAIASRQIKKARAFEPQLPSWSLVTSGKRSIYHNGGLLLKTTKKGLLNMMKYKGLSSNEG